MTNDENDIPQNGRRSIRDIPIPRRRVAARATDDVRPVRATQAPEPASERELARAEAEEAIPPSAPSHPAAAGGREDLPPARAYGTLRSRRRPRGWVKIALGLAVALGLVWLFNWHSASIVITEKRGEKEISLTIPVSIGSVATGTLPAQMIAVSARAERSLPATGEATVQSKAGGTITIVNEYSAEPQTLVRNTRFETPTGLIFRIQEAVTVPGKTAAGGGTLDVRVVADDVGDDYNVGPIARFTVPGFAGKPQFESFYARSSEAMVGGFEGVQKVADPNQIADAVDELAEELRAGMDAAAAAKAGAGSRAFTVPGSFESIATGREPRGDEVVVWVEAGADAFAVADADFADAVAAAVLPGYRAKGEARVDSLESLRVTPKEGSSPALEVIGQAAVTWTVDLRSLEASVLGQPLTSFGQVVARFGGVERADPVVRPFWRSSFPTNSDDIDTRSEGRDIDA